MLGLLIDGRLPLRCDGQLERPKSPPFSAVAVPGPAAVVHLAIPPGLERIVAVFREWYRVGAALPGIVSDERNRVTIQAAWWCVGMEWHEGIQATRAWDAPLRRAEAPSGASLLYRASPRFQEIAVPVYEYRLETDAYAMVERLRGDPAGWRG